MNIDEKTIAIIAKVFKKGISEVTPFTLLREDLKAKSMNFMEVQALLENEFQIDIAAGKVTKVKSVQDIIQIVKEYC